MYTVIGNVATFQKGFAFKSKDYQKFGHRIIRVSNLNKNAYDESDCIFIDEEKAKAYAQYTLNTNDAVISTVGSWPTNPESVVGKVTIIPQSINGSLLNQNAVRLRAINGCTQEYLNYLLLSDEFKSYIIGTAQGSASQASIKLEDIRKFAFDLPIEDTQNKITHILSILDSMILNNKKINDNLEQQAQTIFRAWFMEYVPFGGALPADWIRSTLGAICSCELGGTPSRAKPEYWNGNIPWINSGEVNRFRIIKPSEMITELGLSKSATKILPVKTTVIAITGATLGQVSLLEIASCANQSVVGVVPNAQLPYEFIYPFIKANIQELISHQTGGAQQHINKQNVENLPVVLPSEEVLKEYVGLVGGLYAMIANNCFENEKLSAIRDSLLPRLMSGEIDVSNIVI